MIHFSYFIRCFNVRMSDEGEWKIDLNPNYINLLHVLSIGIYKKEDKSTPTIYKVIYKEYTEYVVSDNLNGYFSEDLP